MGVAQCKEVTGRDGSEDKLANKRYTRTFQVLTDDPGDGAKTVLACVDLPAIGDTWKSVNALGGVVDADADSFCVERKATQNNRDWPMDWMVTCEYVGRDDPTLEPAEVSFAGSKYQVAMQQDIYGNWVRNSAGDPFEGGLTRDRTRFTVMINQNVLTWDPIAALGYIDTLNEDPFLSTLWPPGFNSSTCKLSELNATAVWLEDRSAIHYWKRQAKVEIEANGWNTQILDAGFRKLDAGVQKLITDSLGRKLSSPGLLDGAGNVIASAGTPVFLVFAPYETVDWSPLGLEIWTH